MAMFNVGFGEILLVMVVFIITIEPSKFKEYISTIRFFYLKFHNIKRDVLDQIGFLENPEKYITGDDGKKYLTYDIVCDTDTKDEVKK